MRKLSIFGKVLIVKTLGVSKFSFLPTEIVKRINNIIFEFIWGGGGKTNKVSKHISIQDYNRGGIRMIDFGNIVSIKKYYGLRNS